MIDRANSLGLQDCVQLLQQNLQQEVNASATLAAVTHQLSLLQARAVQAATANNPMPDQQVSAPNVPVPNPSPGPSRQSLPNQPDAMNYPKGPNPNVAAGPQMPNQLQPSQAVNQQAQNPSSTTSTSTFSSQLQGGMQVVGSDMGNIGKVDDIRENDFLVDIPMHRDLYVPFSAIQNMDNGRVVLNVQGDHIYDMGWPKPPLV